MTAENESFYRLMAMSFPVQNYGYNFKAPMLLLAKDPIMIII